MKKYLLITLLLIGSFAVRAQQFKWITGGGSTLNLLPGQPGVWKPEGTYALCTDSAGNVYGLSEVGNIGLVVDTFSYSNTDTSTSTRANILLYSYNCSGQLRFAKLLQCANESVPYGLAIDANNNIYVAGYFDNQSNNPMLSIGADTVIIGHANQPAALLQFDSLGHFNWVQYIGADTTNTYPAIAPRTGHLAIDNVGNVHFVMYLLAGLQVDSSYTTQSGTYDFTYDVAGILKDIKPLSLDTSIRIKGFDIDRSTGYLYAYGFRNSQDSAQADSLDAGFLAAFDMQRNMHWQYWFDTTAGGHAQSIPNGIVCDNKGYVYICGTGLANNSGTRFAILNNNQYYFYAHTQLTGEMSVILKVDTAGNTDWISQFDGTRSSRFNSIALSKDRVAAAGWFTDTIYLWDPAYCCSPPIPVAGDSLKRPFLGLVDTDGTVITLKSLKTNGQYNLNAAYAVAIDRQGSAYIGGSLEDSIFADSVNMYHSTGGNTDFFVAKYGYNCNCTPAVAQYTWYNSNDILYFNYTGTTDGVDSIVWTLDDINTFYNVNVHDTGISIVVNFSGIGQYLVCVTAYNACGANTYCDTVILDESVPNLLEGQPITVYPNPTTGTLRIANAQNGTKAIVYNMLGQNVYMKTLDTSGDINIGDLKPGSYILQLTDNKGSTAAVSIVKE